jgi:hypothetical protein
MHDAASALVWGHPVADLQERELEDAQIHYITRMITNLYAIAHVKGLSLWNERPAGKVGHWFPQDDRQPRWQQSHEGTTDRLPFSQTGPMGAKLSAATTYADTFRQRHRRPMSMPVSW